MNILINTMKRDYTTIPNRLILDSNLGSDTKILMCYLLQEKFNENFLFDDDLIEQIQKDLNFTVQQIHFCYNQLIKRDYLGVVK